MNLKLAEEISNLMMSLQGSPRYKVTKRKDYVLFSGKNVENKDEKYSIMMRIRQNGTFELVSTVHDPQNCVGVFGGPDSNQIVSDFLLNTPKSFSAKYYAGKIGCLRWPTSESLVTSVLFECIELFKEIRELDKIGKSVETPWCPILLGPQNRLIPESIKSGTFSEKVLVLRSVPKEEALEIYQKMCKDLVQKEMEKLDNEQFFQVFAKLHEFKFPRYKENMPSEKDVVEAFENKFKDLLKK